MTNTSTERGIFRGEQRLVSDAYAGNTIELRDLRARVRQTTSLISAGTIKERMGEGWAAELETRTIIWRPTMPFPPFANLTQDDILYLIAHEASHLNYSGGYDITKLLPDSWKFSWPGHEMRFHRFVNAVEDIRCDRLSTKEFGTFQELALKIDKKMFAEMARTQPENWHVLDQCAMSWIGMDRGFEPLGSRDGIRKAVRLWKKVDLIANTESTQRVAEELLPIYLKLVDRISGQEQPQTTEEDITILIVVEGLPDSPSDSPVRSTGKPGSEKIPSLAQKLEGMANDASGLAKGKIKVLIAEEVTKQGDAKTAANRLGTGNRVHKPEHHVSASTGLGVGVGTNDDVRGEAMWETWKATVRPQINTLANRLRAVLRTNSADNMTGGHRRGRLQTSKAYRAQAGNPRIFRKRGALGSIDYTMGIIVDCSGSMSGEKITGAQKAVVMIAEAWERAGLDSFILPWDSHLRGLKPIGHSLKGHRYHLGVDLKSGGNTYEAPALVVAQDEFRKVQSGHKLMFSITDGGTSSPEESKQLLDELHAQGVKTVGIGINFQPPRHYTHTLRIDTVEELATLMPRYINEMVRKGR